MAEVESNFGSTFSKSNASLFASTKTSLSLVSHRSPADLIRPFFSSASTSLQHTVTARDTFRWEAATLAM